MASAGRREGPDSCVARHYLATMLVNQIERLRVRRFSGERHLCRAFATFCCLSLPSACLLEEFGPSVPAPIRVPCPSSSPLLESRSDASQGSQSQAHHRFQGSSNIIIHQHPPHHHLPPFPDVVPTIATLQRRDSAVGPGHCSALPTDCVL